MAVPTTKAPPEIVRKPAGQALLGALLMMLLGVLLLIFNAVNMRDLSINTDVKLLAGNFYFSSLMMTFSLALVSSAVLNLGDQS